MGPDAARSKKTLGAAFPGVNSDAKPSTTVVDMTMAIRKPERGDDATEIDGVEKQASAMNQLR